jgi:hypothetical protein
VVIDGIRTIGSKTIEFEPKDKIFQQKSAIVSVLTGEKSMPAQEIGEFVNEDVIIIEQDQIGNFKIYWTKKDKVFRDYIDSHYSGKP